MFFEKIIGGRVLKTGISVFITAFICLSLGWPAIFAVITAIVTIEPTASDSVKKGLIRLPASAIGAAYSMLFTAFLGDKALTYTLSAVLTILTCHKLRLDAGILVATLTAVNMIPITQDHFFDSFLVRMGTTTVGLTVSTLVNLIILPPRYSQSIVQQTASLLKKSAKLLKQVIHEVHLVKKKREIVNQFEQLLKDLEKAEQLCHYQRDVWKYHRHSDEEMKKIHYEHKKLLVIRQILFHIGNLMYTPIDETSKEAYQNEELQAAVNSISSLLESDEHPITEEHKSLMNHLLHYFWQLKGEVSGYPKHLFSAEATILYELLSVNDLVEELTQIEESYKKRERISVPSTTEN